jgi:hypothetical protein
LREKTLQLSQETTAAWLFRTTDILESARLGLFGPAHTFGLPAQPDKAEASWMQTRAKSARVTPSEEASASTQNGVRAPTRSIRDSSAFFGASRTCAPSAPQRMDSANVCCFSTAKFVSA